MSEREIKRRKPRERRKTEYLRARISAPHKQLLQQAADEAGITLGSWAVDRLIKAARAELGSSKEG